MVGPPQGVCECVQSEDEGADGDDVVEPGLPLGLAGIGEDADDRNKVERLDGDVNGEVHGPKGVQLCRKVPAQGGVKD